MRFVIHVEGKGFLYKASHPNQGQGYKVKYCDQVQDARIFSTLSAAKNCKVAKWPGAVIHSVEIKLLGNA